MLVPANGLVAQPDRASPSGLASDMADVNGSGRAEGHVEGEVCRLGYEAEVTRSPGGCTILGKGEDGKVEREVEVWKGHRSWVGVEI